MLISTFVYAISFGWAYAAGLVLLILFHEMGHFIAARQNGLEVGAPVFIPFVGAWISLKEGSMPPAIEAYVAISGPMLGSVAAFGCYLFGISGHGKIYMALAQAGFMLNLFNLIPLAPLDGGRLAGVISPKLWLVGAPMLVGLFFWKPSPLLILVALAASPRLIAAFKGDLPRHETLRTDSEKLLYGGAVPRTCCSLGDHGVRGARMAFDGRLIRE